MNWRVHRSTLSGTCRIPASKSHTIRALLVATLADGDSAVRNALTQGDGESALHVAQAFGATVNHSDNVLTISGVGGDFSRGVRDCDCGNSGTSMRLFSGLAALGEKTRRFDGDRSLRTRTMAPLLEAYRRLGATYTPLGDAGDVPFSMRGPMFGGRTCVSGVTSQFVSSLLFSTPLAEHDTTITVSDLNEKPYVDITLWWLERMGIACQVSDTYDEFQVKGCQSYDPIDIDIPGDFSSATFPAVAALLTGSRLTLTGLDPTDPQGDKDVFTLLSQVGGGVIIHGSSVELGPGTGLVGGEMDLNAMPDALPALAVLATRLSGTTRLANVPQARLKETDRIAVMAEELRKMGAQVEEEPDGLIVHESALHGATVSGHDDHRIVMALALAGMVADGATVIEGAEAASITYPAFLEDFRALGADIEEAF